MGRSNGIHKIHKIGTGVWLQVKKKYSVGKIRPQIKVHSRVWSHKILYYLHARPARKKQTNFVFIN